MKRRKAWWYYAACICVSAVAAICSAQDAEDRDTWNVNEGDWGNDDNWVDLDNALSLTPTFQDDRWALIPSGTATVSGDHKTSGLTISGGTVVVTAGSSLEVDREADYFSVGQSNIDPGGSLLIEGDGSYKGLDGRIRGTVEMGPAGTFELSGDATLDGTYNFTISGDGSPVMKIGGDAKVGGTLSPTFDGVSPAFGDSFTFVQAGSASLNDPVVELPESVVLGRGLEARVEADGGDVNLTIGNLPILTVNRATGAANISNVVGGPLTMTGYSIASALGTLNPDGFTGFGGDGWDTPNPSANSMAEFSLTGEATVAVDDVLNIGNAYNGGPTHPDDEDVVFSFSTLDGRILEGLVEYEGPANDLVLNLNPETGEATIQNLSAFIDPIEVTGYSVSSPSGSLKAESFNGLSDDNEGWTIANPGSNVLAELQLTGSTIFDTGTAFSIGSIFDTAGPRDLVFEFTTQDQLFEGTVAYQVGGAVIPPPTAGLPGDIDGDGAVGFTDFLVLSANFGMTGGIAEGDIDGDGSVGFPDFLVLSSNFGQSAAVAAVPEPTAISMLGLGGLLLLGIRRRRGVSQ